jgi:2,3-bisphosphoglycerate-independent phosphoglycerate mutase
MPDKCILILLDGLGDRAHESLGGLTPLQAAHTPTLDRLADRGSCGLYHAGIVGQALPSENAHFAMFGYGPSEFPGRGPLEALGAGIALDPRDVALLAHITGVEEHGGTLVVRKETDRLPEPDARALMESVAGYTTGGIAMRLHHTNGLFGVLVLQGPASHLITDTNLMREGLVVPALLPRREAAGDPAANRTAAALTEYLTWAYHRLRNHPVNAARSILGHAPMNFVVTQRAGRLLHAEPLAERFGLRCLSISSGLIYRGLCSYLGIDVEHDKDSSDPAEDIARRVMRAKKALKTYDFIHVHTKAPDEAAHEKNPLKKKSVIEALDTGIARSLEPLIDDPSVLLIVASDHSTPSAGPLIHSGEPIPLLFAGGGVRRDAVRRFDEISVAGGALGLVRGSELMYLILNHLDRAKLQGTMAEPADRPYVPQTYEPFRLAGTRENGSQPLKKEPVP